MTGSLITGTLITSVDDLLTAPDLTIVYAADGKLYQRVGYPPGWPEAWWTLDSRRYQVAPESIPLDAIVVFHPATPPALPRPVPRDPYNAMLAAAHPFYPPTHPYAGSNPERAGVGDPGHCERCAVLGHVEAHPDLGCGDVGCHRAHTPGDEPN